MTKSGTKFAVADRVTHFQYGAGTIAAIDSNTTVIDFDKNGRRKFVTSMVQLEPTDVDPVLQERLDDLVGNGRLGQVPEMGDDDLAALAGELRTFEAVVSERRRAFFVAVDALQGELARRYRDGEASVESLLNG